MGLKEILTKMKKKECIECKFQLFFDEKGASIKVETDIDLTIEDVKKINDILTTSFFKQIGLEEEQIKSLMKNRELKSAYKVRSKGDN